MSIISQLSGTTPTTLDEIHHELPATIQELADSFSDLHKEAFRRYEELTEEDKKSPAGKALADICDNISERGETGDAWVADLRKTLGKIHLRLNPYSSSKVRFTIADKPLVHNGTNDIKIAKTKLKECIAKRAVDPTYDPMPVLAKVAKGVEVAHGLMAQYTASMESMLRHLLAMHVSLQEQARHLKLEASTMRYRAREYRRLLDKRRTREQKFNYLDAKAEARKARLAANRAARFNRAGAKAQAPAPAPAPAPADQGPEEDEVAGIDDARPAKKPKNSPAESPSSSSSDACRFLSSSPCH
jgi:hypothetical protein